MTTPMLTNDVSRIINRARLKLNRGPAGIESPKESIENPEVAPELGSEAQALSDLLDQLEA